MKKSASSVEDNFQKLKNVEEFLSTRVNGYLNRTAEFESYEQYSQSFNGTFPEEEKLRVADAIKMYKSIFSFERDYGYSPELDMFSNKGWESQLKGKRLLADNNLDMEIFADIKDGQLMVHNKTSNTHTIVEFKFVFDKEDKYGHIQLSEEGKEMFPRLESALRGKLLVNGGHPVSLNNNQLMDHLNVDSSWMMSELMSLDSTNKIMMEIASSTGPVELDVEHHKAKRDYSESSFDMMR